MDRVIAVEAEPREEFGKNVARRLRRSGRIPAVVYGGGGPCLNVAVDPKKIIEILHSESGHNAIFTLEISDRTPARVMLREWQVEPVHGELLHVDMVRVARDTRLKVKVPVQLVGEAEGVKVQGGVLDFILRELEVECLPDDIPEHITADVTHLTIGRNLRVSDLSVSPQVKVLTDPGRVVVHVVAMKIEEEKPAVEAVEAAAPAEPEVIRKGKVEQPEAAEEGAGEEKEKEKEKGKEKRERSGRADKASES